MASENAKNANIGRVVGINGNLLTVAFDQPIIQNEVAYARVEGLRLKSEIIRIRGTRADLQVFEDTSGLSVGDAVEFTGELLSVELGPGLLGQIYDGLQNPLPELAEQSGFFLQRGMYLDALDGKRLWSFTPSIASGKRVTGGDYIGSVPEGLFEHKIMVPFRLKGRHYSIQEIAPPGNYPISHVVARLVNERGDIQEVTMAQRWPVKIPITCYQERLKPSDPLVTKVRIIDTFFPVARGGTYCIPGPFGAGKTVLQQITSRNADVDIVIIAACGERAGEVVETLREFPTLIDPRTGRSLMERTLIICNTSSMPVAAREASVYTATTIAEYYRQMGLNVLLLADSTSRWAQALREVSGRLEEIPGEEAFPAYLESVIAAFYERGGRVRLNNGSIGSVTIGGTVSPAGGNFEEPVTQSTLKVVGAFHGLSRQRSDARRFPAIDPLESWSKYPSVVSHVHEGDDSEPCNDSDIEAAREMLREGNEVNQMMKVVGEEGTSQDDFIVYLKGEYLDAAYLQQDAYHDIDGVSDAQRQRTMFRHMVGILETDMVFDDKAAARVFFQRLTQTTKDWNRTALDSDEFKTLEQHIAKMIEEIRRGA